MNVGWYLLWFVVAVSLLVTVHEYGHYWVARRLGFKVLRFSVGFGRPLLRRVGRGPDRTEYVLAAIPLGGYVKLLDEREGPVEPAEMGRSFTRRPPWQRIAVLLAGPAFNIVFAILLLWAMFWSGGITEVRPVVGEVQPASVAGRGGLRRGDEILAVDGVAVTGQREVILHVLDGISGLGRIGLAVRGEDGRGRNATLAVTDAGERRRLTEPAALFSGLGFRFWEPPVPAQLGQVLADGPAARAGLQTGDTIVAVDGEPVGSFRDLVASISSRPGETVTVTYRRGPSERTLRVAVAAEEADGRRIGRIRVAPPAISYPDSMLRHTELAPPAALGRAVQEAWGMTVLQARLFWRMLMGQVSLKNLSGPLSIAEYAGDSAEAGPGAFVGFLVLISLSLGFLNLLPIPILDGGQIVFQLAEWAKGSPLSERAQALGQQVGIALLILLMGVALFNDIARQLG